MKKQKTINWQEKVHPKSKTSAMVDFLMVGEGISKKVHTKTYDYLNIIFHNIKSKMTLTSDYTCVVIDYIDTRHQINIDNIDLKRNLKSFLETHRNMLILMKKPSQIPDYMGLVLNGKRMDEYFDNELLKVGFINITDKFYYNQDIMSGLNFEYYAYNNDALTKFFNDTDEITIESANCIKTDTPKGYLTDLIYVANVFTVEKFNAPANPHTYDTRKYIDLDINDYYSTVNNILDNILGRHDKFVLSAQTDKEFEYVNTFLDRLKNRPEYRPQLSTLLKVANSIGMPFELMVSSLSKNPFVTRLLTAFSKISNFDKYTAEKVVSEFEKSVEEALYPPHGKVD